MVSKYSPGWIFFNFLITVTFIFGGGLLIAWSLYTYGFVLLALGIISYAGIWRLFNRTNRNMALFFEAVKSNDTTLIFPVNTQNRSLNMLYHGLNNLNQHIQKLKLEAEVREKYLTAIIRQSATGFVVMNKDFHVELINEAACLLAGISASSSNSNLLKIKNSRLFETLCNMMPGEAVTFKSNNNYSVQQLLLKANQIKTESRELMLYSIHDINPELNKKEIESYQKLISILTHEIMNSLAPLTSISKTLNSIFKTINDDTEMPRSDKLAAVSQGLKVIEEQSEGIWSFVNNYRKLTKIPPPEIKEIDVEEWIRQLYVLYNEICTEKEINFRIKQEINSETLKGDKNLLNQVVVNLINNAIDALDEIEGEKRIQLLFAKDRNAFLIQVGNNGPAIPAELQDKIFIPFYTTKTNGSGIGLSLSGQIVKLHNGSLNVFSDSSAGTIFTIRL